MMMPNHDSKSIGREICGKAATLFKEYLFYHTLKFKASSSNENVTLRDLQFCDSQQQATFTAKASEEEDFIQNFFSSDLNFQNFFDFRPQFKNKQEDFKPIFELKEAKERALGNEFDQQSIKNEDFEDSSTDDFFLAPISEGAIMKMISTLKLKGMWSKSLLPKVLDRPRRRSQWDYCLAEADWLAIDFHEERKWKKAAAHYFAHNCVQEVKRKKACKTHAKRSAKFVASLILNHKKSYEKEDSLLNEKTMEFKALCIDKPSLVDATSPQILSQDYLSYDGEEFTSYVCQMMDDIEVENITSTPLLTMSFDFASKLFSESALINAAMSQERMKEICIFGPPTPPIDDENDFYIDESLEYMYDLSAPQEYYTVFHDSNPLDSELKRHAKKQKRHHEKVNNCQQVSLFDRPSSLVTRLRRIGSERSKYLTASSTTSSLLSNAQKPNLGVNSSLKDSTNWLIHEDWLLFCAVVYLQNMSPSLTVTSPAYIPNWDLTSDVTSNFACKFRSPRECRMRFENLLNPKEENVSRQSPVKKTKTSNSTRLVDIAQFSKMYHSDCHSTYTNFIIKKLSNIMQRKNVTHYSIAVRPNSKALPPPVSSPASVSASSASHSQNMLSIQSIVKECRSVMQAKAVSSPETLAVAKTQRLQREEQEKALQNSKAKLRPSLSLSQTSTIACTTNVNTTPCYVSGTSIIPVKNILHKINSIKPSLAQVKYQLNTPITNHIAYTSFPLLTSMPQLSKATPSGPSNVVVTSDYSTSTASLFDNFLIQQQKHNRFGPPLSNTPPSLVVSQQPLANVIELPSNFNMANLQDPSRQTFSIRASNADIIRMLNQQRVKDSNLNVGTKILSSPSSNIITIFPQSSMNSSPKFSINPSTSTYVNTSNNYHPSPRLISSSSPASVHPSQIKVFKNSKQRSSAQSATGLDFSKMTPQQLLMRPPMPASIGTCNTSFKFSATPTTSFLPIRSTFNSSNPFSNPAPMLSASQYKIVPPSPKTLPQTLKHIPVQQLTQLMKLQLPNTTSTQQQAPFYQASSSYKTYTQVGKSSQNYTIITPITSWLQQQPIESKQYPSLATTQLNYRNTQPIGNRSAITNPNVAQFFNNVKSHQQIISSTPKLVSEQSLLANHSIILPSSSIQNSMVNIKKRTKLVANQMPLDATSTLEDFEMSAKRLKTTVSSQTPSSQSFHPS